MFTVGTNVQLDEKMSDYMPPSIYAQGKSGPPPAGASSPINFVNEASSELRRPKLAVRLGTPLIIPEGYGCVIMTGIASVMLLSWKSMRVSSARRELQVPNPLTYSDKSMAFNCVFRALQSTIEIYPQFLFLLLTGGLEMPYFCSLGGIIWILGRYVYAKGYYSGDPRRRANGSFFAIGQIMLGIGAVKFALKRLMA